MARLEGLGEDDVEGINWNITTESIIQPSNNTLPLHKQQDRNTWNHGFQNTGSRSFSTEDFLLGIKTKNCELLGEQPKTSTPNTSTDMGSPLPNNPMTSTPQEPRRSPDQHFDTMSSPGPDFTYINEPERSEVTTLEEKEQPNETKERSLIEQAQWQIKNHTEAKTTNVTNDYDELIKEVTMHSNYKTTNYDAASYGLNRIHDWKTRGKEIGKEMIRILNKDPNPCLEAKRKNLEVQIASTAENLSTTDKSQGIRYRRTP